MKPFDIDALRRAMADAHSNLSPNLSPDLRTDFRPDAASDLVRRTLAQHGLMADGANSAAQTPLSAMAGLLSRQVQPAAVPVPAVPGASFASDRFTCAAGARDYLTYIPASAAEGAAGLIVMLHGCTQTPADFATGTAMNALAEQHRLVIVYPQQSRGDNAQSCWNWFSPGDQRRDRGEPAILAGHLAKTHDIAPSQIYVAGLSAGAAMAVILGQTYPEVFAAVGTHSGLPFGRARDVASAFAVMGGGGGAAPADHKPTPTIIFQGSADHTVNAVNADQIAADVLAAGPELTLFDRASQKAHGRGVIRETTTTSDGAVLLEYWKIDGLGHAWSGGNPAGSYADAAGPDASTEMVRFFLQHGQRNG